MLFSSAMCICCRSKRADIKFRNGDIGICGRCLDRLQRTGPAMNFEGQRYADYIISPFYYTDGFRSAILDYKFSGAQAYADIFTSLMTHALDGIKYVLGEFDLLVPVPLSKKRINERGYNQSELIANPLSEFIGIEYRTDVLRRDKNTRHQAGLRNYERMTNVKNAFSTSDYAEGKSVIIFDDIYTTGATVDECARALKLAGAGKIIGLTLSITERHLIRPEVRLF